MTRSEEEWLRSIWKEDAAPFFTMGYNDAIADNANREAMPIDVWGRNQK